jgi:hypothetical protein
MENICSAKPDNSVPLIPQSNSASVKPFQEGLPLLARKFE